MKYFSSSSAEENINQYQYPINKIVLMIRHFKANTTLLFTKHFCLFHRSILCINYQLKE